MIVYDMPMEDYLALPELSSSQLKKANTTLADFKAALAEKSEETKFTLLGTAIHTALLEPDKFDDIYVMQPENWGPRNKGRGYQRWKEFKANNIEKICLTWEQSLQIKAIHRAAKANEFFQELLKDAIVEVTATAKLGGLNLKARTDMLLSDGFGDVKSCGENLDDANLFKVIFSNGYHFQAAHHMQVINENLPSVRGKYYWIFVSTGSPATHVRVVQAPEELLEWGYRDHNTACKMVYRAMQSNDWPGYAPVLNNLEIPQWARNLYDE